METYKILEPGLLQISVLCLSLSQWNSSPSAPLQISWPEFFQYWSLFQCYQSSWCNKLNSPLHGQTDNPHNCVKFLSVCLAGVYQLLQLVMRKIGTLCHDIYWRKIWSSTHVKKYISFPSACFQKQILGRNKQMIKGTLTYHYVTFQLKGTFENDSIGTYYDFFSEFCNCDHIYHRWVLIGLFS